MNTSQKKGIVTIAISVTSFLVFAGSLLFGLQAAQAAPTAQTKEDTDIPAGIYRSAGSAVQFDVSPSLRTLSPIPAKPTGQTEIPALPTGLEGALGPQDVDSLVQAAVGVGDMPTPVTSFDGPPNNSNVSPPDPVGDVGPNHYVAMSNLSFQIFDKAGNSLYGPALNNTLWAGFGGACQDENGGDPIVLYDQMADRWFLTQFTTAGPTYYNCVAVSTTGDPTGTYYRYAFSTGSNLPDYPKYGIWPDALYFSTREFAGGASFVGIGAYAVNRAQLIAGNPSPTVISFLVTPASAGGIYNIGDGLLPADMDGSTPPPPGTPNFFVGSMDNGGPYGAPQDALTLWKFSANFTDPASSTFILANTIPIASYDTIFPCSGGSRSCIPQPGTTNRLDILSYAQRPTWRLAYRNFGTYETLVTNQSVEAATDIAGIRWWEIRSPNSSPFIHQQGTYAPGVSDGIHRWMGSIAMDQEGNMALGYSASDATSTFPSVWYTGRLASDPLGTMPQGENAIINGSGSQLNSQRWGDYTSMNIDPVDDCTFWYVNQYLPVSSSVGWRLRIGAFSFPECGSPNFELAATPTSQAICKPADASYEINVGSLVGFSDPVTLSASGQPASTTASFSVNPVTPSGTSLFTIGNTAAAPLGNYMVEITGVASTSTITTSLALSLFDAIPGWVSLSDPVNFATGQPVQPTFSWVPSSQAAGYDLEIASDSQFNTLVYSTVGLPGSSHTPSTPLDPDSLYYWRVRASNACGTGEYSATFVFVTGPTPGSCPVGVTPLGQYSEDFETGAPGWTHSGTGDTWTLSGFNPYSGSSAFHAGNPATVSDQLLVSPAISLPAGENPLTLSFWNYQHMETSTGGCYDGGILEVSTDAGSSWTQVPGADLLSDPYDGPISPSFSNPLANLDAWCGNNPQPFLNSLVDVSAYAGQTAQFRFRLGSDNSVARPGWDIDDVAVESCPRYLAFLGLDQAQTTLPGSGVDYEFTLLNRGQADIFTLDLSGNAWPTTLLNPTVLSVDAGSKMTVTVHVDTPPVAPNSLDVSDTFTLVAYSNGDPAQYLQTTGTTRTIVTPGLELAPAAQSKSGNPGGLVDYTYTLDNTGSYTDTYTLSISGNDWPTTAPASIELGEMQGAVVHVQVSIPPLAPISIAALVSDSFTLTATSALDSSLSVQAGGTTSAVANPAVSLAANPSSGQGAPGQTVLYNLTVTNGGDYPDSYDLFTGGSWGTALSAINTGTVMPGESAPVQLWVTVPAAAASGDDDITTVSAISLLDAGVENSLDITTTAGNYTLFLPLVEH